MSRRNITLRWWVNRHQWVVVMGDGPRWHGPELADGYEYIINWFWTRRGAERWADEFEGYVKRRQDVAS